MKLSKGFTLLEVLIALAIIAIGLGALIKASSLTIQGTYRLKEKTLKHWVAMQGVAMIQLGLLEISPQVPATQKTTMFNRTWYWRANLQPTLIPFVEQIEITISPRPSGPFTDPLIAFRYHVYETT